MTFSIRSLVLVVVTASSFQFGDARLQNYNPDKIQTIVDIGQQNVDYRGLVNSSVQYVYQFTFNASSYGRDGDIRVHSYVENGIIQEEPVMFVVRQQESVMSWQLPQISKSGTYSWSSRTLCNEPKDEEAGDSQTIFVTVSTANAENVTFTINVSSEKSFVMTLDQDYNTTISPPSPRFYRFIFSEAENATLPVSISSQFALLEVFSEDTICMTVSVQNTTVSLTFTSKLNFPSNFFSVQCPVLDEENNVQFEGYWQTMSTKAGMTLNRDYFPNGFYVVFVVHSDDSRCATHQKQVLSLGNRVKQIKFNITPKITYLEYVLAIFGLVTFFFLFYLLAAIISICHCYRAEVQLPVDGNPAPDPNSSGIGNPIPVETEGHPNANGGAEGSSSGQTGATAGPSTIAEQRLLTEARRQRFSKTEAEKEDTDSLRRLDSDDSSLDEEEIDVLNDARKDKNVYRASASSSLFVSALSRKNPRVLAKKSKLYLWTLITVAIFYAIPVLQLVFTYQQVLHTTGNLDMCYYNYLCAHPLWILSDFNHVYSNIGYILLGILFLILVYRKDLMHQRRLAKSPGIDIEKFGVPRHFGLFYAMGLALVMEGVLSGCYHICPNGSNFQFDTCFMYVIALMCILKIYQTRHPDINANAYATFAVLAFVILFGVLGVLVGNIYFWSVFTTLHVLFCLFLTFQVYYLGRWRLNCGLFRRVYNRWKQDCLAGPLYCLRPKYPDRLILLILANAANWGIAGYGFHYQSPDFATHLLLIFMTNLLIYTIFYIVMKLGHGETILVQPAIYTFLTVGFWALGCWIFLQKSTSWQKSPAESRVYNHECLILRFYDTHDIWHVVSSIGLFVWYMMLLTLDDDLLNTPRDKIKVF